MKMKKNLMTLNKIFINYNDNEKIIYILAVVLSIACNFLIPQTYKPNLR